MISITTVLNYYFKKYIFYHSLKYNTVKSNKIPIMLILSGTISYNFEGGKKV